ncbi:hypothetical protein ACFVTY_39895 [Streptomyces sp. NPDC058067]|uniref:hypothetical protein n=1 Tax=Streptomyces sp. NPDC058067 TaxID=3346324 RepID=UPI0036F18019
MRTAAGDRCRSLVAVAALVATLSVASCGTSSGPTGSRTTKSGDTAHPKGDQSSPNTPPGYLTWEFEHIADFSGKVSDIAALSKDDVWAVATENNGQADAHLLHFDGTEWKREPLPDALGATTYPPILEEVGQETLWLRPSAMIGAGGVTGESPGPLPWAQWDGTRWSTVPNLPPGGEVADFEAAGPDDIWTLDQPLEGRPSARHWDGSRWTTTRLRYAASDLAIAGPDDVWAVGSRSTGPGTELGFGESYNQPVTMHWDGTSWKSVETPQFRFEEPIPPEPGASLQQVFALDDGEVRAYGKNTFNHGETDDEPADEFIRLRWDGSTWAEQEPAPGECGRRIPVGQDDWGLFLDGNWYLTDDGRCVKIKRHRLPLSTGARKESNQSLWLEEIHRVPGTDEWLGAGHVQVNQSRDGFGAPVVVRLKRGG